MIHRLALFALFLTACIEDVGTGKVAAEVAPPPAPTEAPAKPAPAPAGETVAVDTSRSRIHVLGAKITQKHEIVFDAWRGELQRDGDALSGIDITVDMKSLRADADRLTGHLMNEDFFEVETFPTATFRSASIEARPGENGATHQVTGDLTMHGVTKRVGFPARISTEGGLEAHTEFVIDRKDFGITYPGKPDDLIQDNVVLTIDLVAGA